MFESDRMVSLNASPASSTGSTIDLRPPDHWTQTFYRGPRLNALDEEFAMLYPALVQSKLCLVGNVRDYDTGESRLTYTLDCPSSAILNFVLRILKSTNIKCGPVKSQCGGEPSGGLSMFYYLTVSIGGQPNYPLSYGHDCVVLEFSKLHTRYLKWAYQTTNIRHPQRFLFVQRL